MRKHDIVEAKFGRNKINFDSVFPLGYARVTSADFPSGSKKVPRASFYSECVVILVLVKLW